MKLICIVAVGIMSASIVCLAGCAHKTSGKRPHGERKQLRFAFVTTCVDEDFFNPVKRGMCDAATQMGVECTFVGTDGVDVKAQADMVRKAVADGYDGIALNIIDPVAFDEVVGEAMGRGIPVVAFNVDDYNTPNARLSGVCQDLYKAGRTLGEKAAEFIPKKSMILMTVHSEGISALEDRLRSAQDILKGRGITWKIVVTGTTPDGAAQVIASKLKENPKIKVVLCTGQADTEGAGLAIEKHFKGKGYSAAGFDLSPEILRLIKASHIKFSIDQQPYIQGFYPVVQLTHYCRYGILPSDINAGASIITKSNVDDVAVLSKQGYR